jgi:putative tricarboxylic transport membrane protein
MKYPMAPLVLGIVLGDIFDKSFRRSWVIHDGDFMFYFTRPICVILMAMCLFTFLMSFSTTRKWLQHLTRILTSPFVILKQRLFGGGGHS